MKLSEIITKINYLISELQWYLPLDNVVEKQHWDKIRLDWNYHSNNMEGILVSFEQTQELMLKRGVITGKKIKDCKQVIGHDDAIAEVKNHLKENRPFTEHFIRGLHELLLKEEYFNPAITPDGKPTQKLVQIGDYKTTPNNVETSDGLFMFASPDETRMKMADLMKLCNAQLEKNTKHPLLIATEFHYGFIRIHPFDDGNGRIARLLTNYILMYFQYPPIIIEAKQKEEYIKALRKADKGSLAELKKFFGLHLIEAINNHINVAKNGNINTEGDLKKKILLLTKKLENTYMRNAKSNKFMVEAITNAYTPLLFETDKTIQAVSHLFVESSWHFFEEPKDGKIPAMSMTWGLKNIIYQFATLAQTQDSYHHFKVMNWLHTLRTKEKKVDVEIAFKIFFGDFDYKIKAYIGRPMESSIIMGGMIKLINQINENTNPDSRNTEFEGFEYIVYQADYGTIPLRSDVISLAEELGLKFVGYIEKKAGLNPHKDDTTKKTKFPFLKKD